MSVKIAERNQEKPGFKTKEDRQTSDVHAQKFRAQCFQHVMHEKKNSHRHLMRRSTDSVVKKINNKEHTAEHVVADKNEPFNKFCDTDARTQPKVNNFNREIEKISETNANVIADTAVGTGRADDINYLIKKLTMNFHAKQQKVRFSIATGVFAGSQFALLTNDNDLILRVNNASEIAQELLKANKYHLKNSLAEKEINLQELLFL